MEVLLVGILRKARQIANRLRLFRPENGSADRVSQLRICKVEELERARNGRAADPFWLGLLRRGNRR